MRPFTGSSRTFSSPVLLHLFRGPADCRLECVEPLSLWPKVSPSSARRSQAKRVESDSSISRRAGSRYNDLDNFPFIENTAGGRRGKEKENCNSSNKRNTPSSSRPPHCMPTQLPYNSSRALHLVVAMLFATGLSTRILRRPTVRPDAFWCPMHPDIRSADAGKCPLCSMELVRIPAPAHGVYELNATQIPGADGKGDESAAHSDSPSADRRTSRAFRTFTSERFTCSSSGGTWR